MENLIKLAVAVAGARSDQMVVGFLSRALHRWKKLRNDVAHKSRAVEEFLSLDEQFLEQVQRVLETIGQGIKTIEDHQSIVQRLSFDYDEFLKDVVKNINKV